MNAPLGRLRRPHVLVVDDVEANRQLVCRRLADGGYQLQQAESGEQALEFIRATKPDLVLLDYMMPNMNGIEVLRIMRKEIHLAQVPVIMLTARAEAEAVVSALEAGADDYVTKPIDFEVLRARMETQLAKMRSSDQLRQANAALDERSTMHVMAFDELREELEREIQARRRAEAALKDAIGRAENCQTCDFAAPEQQAARASAKAAEAGTQTTTRAAEATRAIGIIDVLGRALEAGKPINPALLSALRLAVTSLGR